jgi:4-hydroxybenzoate polyprenyltransferase
LKARALGRLLRLSLAPSAAADVAAGLVFAGRGAFPTGAGPWLLMASSLAVYTGALALNDWADRERDARERPARPIPSGGISARAALGIALGAMALGVALGFAAGPSSGLWMGALAVLAASYDLAGRGPFIGPALLGLCRAGNLGAGLCWSSGGAPLPAGFWLVAGIYGAYVFVASRLGRMEDREETIDPTRVRRLLLVALLAFPLLAAVLLLPLPGLPGPGVPIEAPLALAAAWGLVAAARQSTWSPAHVERAMGLVLRRLLAFDAVLALSSARFSAAGWDGVAVSAAILAGYPLAHRLRRVFPPS